MDSENEASTSCKPSTSSFDPNRQRHRQSQGKHARKTPVFSSSLSKSKVGSQENSIRIPQESQWPVFSVDVAQKNRLNRWNTTTFMPSSGPDKDNSKTSFSSIAETKPKRKRSDERNEQKKSKPMNRNLFAAVTLGMVFMLISAMAAILIFTFLFTESIDHCDLTVPPTEYQLQLCDRQNDGKKCTFDVSLCNFPCKLGYQLDEYGCPISCSCSVHGNFETDIFFDPVNIQNLLSNYISEEDNLFDSFLTGASPLNRLWPKSDVLKDRVRIPYITSKEIEADSKWPELLQGTFDAISRLTCIDFYPKTDEPDFIEFISQRKGCQSSVGMVGGRQFVGLSEGCKQQGMIEHALLHVMGFWHEHTRNDRDEHVIINQENIMPGFEHNFRKRGKHSNAKLSGYDWDSLLHPSSTFYSADGNPTIVTKVGDTMIKFQRMGFSVGDVVKINNMYDCQTASTVESGVVHNWGSWSSWSDCSASCGDGHQVQTRECQNFDGKVVAPSVCGKELSMSRPCSSGYCDDGLWGAWSSCSASCGAGHRHRVSCCSPHQNYTSEVCIQASCPESSLPGSWAEWQSWDDCRGNCGKGYRKRVRSCKSDSGGQDLPSSDCPATTPHTVQYDICIMDDCTTALFAAADEEIWSEWTRWTPCQKECGNEFQTRTRVCETDDDCPGPRSESRSCNRPCPEDLGDWTDWGVWSNCSKPCMGTMKRERVCMFEHDQIVLTCPGEINAVGKQTEKMPCSKEGADCDFELQGWTQWSSWSECTKPCNGGTKARTRECNPEVVEGPSCAEDAVQIEECNTKKCEEGEWGEWSTCEGCGPDDVIHRTRKCQAENFCVDLKNETLPCVKADCPIEGGEIFTDDRYRWLSPSPFCLDGVGHIVDLNGDHQLDLVCLTDGLIETQLGKSWQPYFTPTWNATTEFCRKAYEGVFYVGDVNGDGTADLICHEKLLRPSRSLISVLLSNRDGSIEGDYTIPFVAYFNMFCERQEMKLLLGDLDSDRMLDMACTSSQAVMRFESVRFNFWHNFG